MFQASAVLTVTRKDERSIAGGLTEALDTINRPCSTPGHIQPCGTLADVNQTLRNTSNLIITAHTAVYNANQVEQMELRMLPVWNQKFTETLTGVDKTVSTLDSSVQQLTKASIPILDDTDATVRRLDALAGSPYIESSLQDIASSSRSIADATKQADAILADGRVEADKFVHPPKKKLTFWGGVMATVEVVHKFEPPLF